MPVLDSKNYLLLVLLMLPATAAFASGDAAQNRKTRNQSTSDCNNHLGNYVHGGITFREFNHYLYVLRKASQLPGIGEGSPSFDFKSALKGEVSILSLGEGDSTFIYELNRVASENHRALSHHAVDTAFDTSEEIVFNIGSMEAFPQNYHSQLFQDLDITDPDGNRILFDEIISSHSFSYVLDHYLIRRSRGGNKAEQLLKRVIDHLKPGGVFRSWRLDGGLDAPLEEILAEFRRGGIIRAYGVGHEINDGISDLKLFWLRK